LLIGACSILILSAFSTESSTTLGIFLLNKVPAFNLACLIRIVRVKLQKVLNLLDFEDYRDVELIELSHFLLLEVLDLLFSFVELHRDTLLLLLKTLALNLEVINEYKDVLLLIVHLGTLLSELVDLIDLVLFLRKTDDGIVLVLIFFLLFGLLLFRLLFFIFGTLCLLCILCAGIAATTFALTDLLNLLKVGPDDVVLVRAFGTQLMELGHKVVFAYLDLIDLDLLVLQLGRDAIDLSQDDSLVLAALGQTFSQLVITTFHRPKEDQLFEIENKFHLSILEVRLKAILFLLHILNLIVEGRNQAIDLSGELVLFELKLNALYLSHFLVKIAVLNSLALSVDAGSALSVLILCSVIFGVLSFLFLSLSALLATSGTSIATLRLGSRGGFLGTETFLVGGCSGLFTVSLDFAIVLNVLVLDLKELLRVLDCLIDSRLKEV
jgi:hypothetical protein